MDPAIVFARIYLFSATTKCPSFQVLRFLSGVMRTVTPSLFK